MRQRCLIRVRLTGLFYGTATTETHTDRHPLALHGPLPVSPVGARVPGWGRPLLVPAALCGTELAGRLFGAASGDPVHSGIVQALIIEALTVLLMVGSWWVLSRPAAVPVDGTADVVR